MTATRYSEIESYLEYKDYGIALRRLLDLSLGTEHETTIRKAIDLSLKYRRIISAQNLTPDQESQMLLAFNNCLARVQEKLPEENKERNVLLKADQISKAYGHGRFKLDPINLEIKQGDIIGIVGENGNGKTTLLRCIGGQLAINGGVIDYPLFGKVDEYAIRSKVAFIPQRIPRWFGLLKDNLHFNASISGVHGSDNDLMVDFMLERLGLSEFKDLRWNEISSGYRTRFEIARILLQKPSILILDEPLANLDINTQEIILKDLQFMAKSNARPFGIVLSSQQLHEVEKIADRVVVLKQGREVHAQNNLNESKQSDEYVIEIETNAERVRLNKILEGFDMALSYNGGFIRATSTTLTAQEMLHIIMQHDITLSYYRDITFSTKRFF